MPRRRVGRHEAEPAAARGAAVEGANGPDADSPAAPAAAAAPLDLELRFDPAAPPPDWPAIFGRSAPLRLEIGTGNGAFMSAEAAARPDADHVGIERAGEFFGKFLRRMEREGRTNVRCVNADANEFLPRAFADGALDAAICNFSDPWPKRRHRDRRVFRPPFMEELERAIRDGGTLAFKTDVGWYFDLTVEMLRRRPQWTFEEIGPAAPPDADKGEATTNFEGRARRAGIEVWGFVARLKKIAP